MKFLSRRILSSDVALDVALANGGNTRSLTTFFSVWPCALNKVIAYAGINGSNPLVMTNYKEFAMHKLTGICDGTDRQTIFSYFRPIHYNLWGICDAHNRQTDKQTDKQFFLRPVSLSSNGS